MLRKERFDISFAGLAGLGFASQDGLFDFALSKTPTSRAKNAREMGHPRFSFPLEDVGARGTRGRLRPFPHEFGEPWTFLFVSLTG